MVSIVTVLVSIYLVTNLLWTCSTRPWTRGFAMAEHPGALCLGRGLATALHRRPKFVIAALLICLSF